ncbi:MAG TPA: SDR family oxidoreductase [Kofleriaceae bacterium]|nr:SDR family oxidoreductase [Kofleriaceae bacterium]
MHVVVTGANRGIGLELARQLRARGDTVDAGVRDPAHAPELHAIAGVRVHRVDVTDQATVDALATALDGAAIDLVINNAGVYGGSRQSLRGVDFADALHTFDINALGALRVSLALLPHVRRGQGKKLVHVTSGMGSIEDNGTGGFYAYRMSKAALNMMSRSLAVDLRPEGIASYVINPGWVQTDMGGAGAPTPVDVAVRAILREIDKATLADSGAFLDYKGGRYPW